MLRHIDIETSSRFAGDVDRYHAWPTLRPQTIAAHSFHVMRIWYHIWGDMPPEVSTSIMWHDLGELVTGDIPFNAKRRAPDIRPPTKALEAVAVLEMGGPVTLGTSAEQEAKIKLCDLIEMMEFGIVEMAMGNNLCGPVINATYALIRHKVAELGIEDAVRVGAYMKKVIEATKTFGVDIDDWINIVPLKKEKVA